MKNLFFYLLVFAFALASCSNDKEKEINGIWRAELYIQNDTLPFLFELKDSAGLKMVLINAEERLLVEDIVEKEDSLIINMHIFDTEIRTQLDNDKMSGFFRKKYSDGYILGFSAEKDLNYRFSKNPKGSASIEGRWEVNFESENDSISSIGEFSQEGSAIKGTFLTITGDYRYLEGEMDNKTLKLSCFDGEHAFLFKAKLNDDGILEGTFKSGISWNESWTAERNESIELLDAYSLTYLKEDFDSLYFALPDMLGDTLYYPNESSQNKVILIQIFGTWCPNCMDETRFLSEWYDENKSRGVEIYAVSFERKNDLNYASERVEKIKNKLGANYKFLFGGPSDKEFASRVFPMLNKIISFPTLIFIDREGKVRHIHTGFSGPGTGKYYENFKKDFYRITEELINS